MNVERWSPGLDNGRCSLREVYATMPRDPPDLVPWSVRLLENPRSPVALAGAVDLFGHDCIHIVLGRGLLPRDEAFVLGFTMGASGESSRWQELVYRFCARHVYPGIYRFSRHDAAVFDLALDCGRRAGTVPLHRVDFSALFDRPLREIRNRLNVSLPMLYAAFATEETRWPTAAPRPLAVAS